jgi:hypothetical protein
MQEDQQRRGQEEGKGEPEQLVPQLGVLPRVAEPLLQSLSAGGRHGDHDRGRQRSTNHEKSVSGSPRRAHTDGDGPNDGQRKQHHDAVDDERMQRETVEGVEHRVPSVRHLGTELRIRDDDARAAGDGVTFRSLARPPVAGQGRASSVLGT